MAASSIEWTEATWNPVTGCDRTSPGCDNCYALTLAKRLKAMGQPKYQRDGDPTSSGPGFGLTVHEQELPTPLRWKKARRVFVNSMSDLFHPDVPVEFIASVFDTMRSADWHTFQVLTKRPQRMADVVAEVCPDPLPNVWLGTSIENDRYAFRADHLRRTPASIRFVSLEPLLGAVPSLNLTDIDWAIVGGESGHEARRLELAWVRAIRDQCDDASTALFVKQLGAQWSVENGYGRSHGGDWTVWPEDIRIRKYPTSPLMLV